MALPFVFGGATFLRQDAGSVKPDEVLEATATTTEGEDGRQRLEAGEGGPAEWICSLIYYRSPLRLRRV